MEGVLRPCWRGSLARMGGFRDVEGEVLEFDHACHNRRISVEL